jgi:hypothetical protein
MAISETPWSFIADLNKSSKAVVKIVTVGMPLFSVVSWSSTNHVVQCPQSAWAAMTMSGFFSAISAAIFSLF